MAFRVPILQTFIVHHAAIMLGVYVTVLPTTGTAAEITTLTAGYESQARAGDWTPVSLTINGLESGQSVRLDVRAVDARGNELVESGLPATAQADGPAQLRTFVRIGRLDTPIQVGVVDHQSSRVIAQRTVRCRPASARALPDEQTVQSEIIIYRQDVQFLMVVGELFDMPEFLEEARLLAPDAPPVIGIQIESTDGLPDTIDGLQMFSTVVITGAMNLNDQQLTSLQHWTQQGGHLLVSGTSNIIDHPEKPEIAWLNEHFDFGTTTRNADDRMLASLQSIVPRSERMFTMSNRLACVSVRGADLTILAGTDAGPLISRASAGAGRITLIAFDITTTFLKSYAAWQDLYSQLILGGPLATAAEQTRSSRISSSGVSDLSTQLMATIDARPTSGRWSTWSVIAIGFAWLVLIGPLDYLLVVVVLRRPHWTWLTFPVWVIGAVCLLYSFKPLQNDAVLNTVQILDVSADGDTQVFQNTALASLSASRTTRISLSAACTSELPSGDVSSLVLHWSGRPEDAYGCMYRATGLGASLPASRHSAEDPSTLLDVPVLVDGSTETEVKSSSVASSALIESSLSVSGFALLDGEITHHLPVPIEDWVLAYGSRVYLRRGENTSLSPGVPWTFRRSETRVTDLKSWLTGRRTSKGSSTEQDSTDLTRSRPYNVYETDPLDIVTMMSLHETAEGTIYTGLTHHARRHMDLSNSVEKRVAVLIGRLPLQTITYEVDGKTIEPARSDTIVRLLLPVAQGSEDVPDESSEAK